MLVGKLICVLNDNNVLIDFFKICVYDKKREFKVIISLFMDILVFLNLECLIFYFLGNDVVKIVEFMNVLNI